MGPKSLQFEHLNGKLKGFSPASKIPVPPSGWLKSIRESLGISLLQLGKKMSMTQQGVRAIEIREKEGSVTLNSLREIADAMDMQLVYGFVPKDGTLEALVERKARELATQIVLRTSNTMSLEDQENSKARIEKAIKEKTEELKREMPSVLWDQI